MTINELFEPHGTIHALIVIQNGVELTREKNL
jgi:hypothetical protein